MFDDAMQEFESDFDEFEFDDGELEPEAGFEDEFDDQFEVLGGDDEFELGSTEGVFTEDEEMELALELLSVGGDQELDQFLGKLVRRAGKKIRRFAKSSTGRALGKLLKGAAKKALPLLGRAAGTALGGPVGGALGARLASAGGRVFGLELEGLSPEDQEFEVARRFVRFAGEAAANAAKAPKSAPATKVAVAATKSAARKHAPGLSTGAAAAAAAPTSFGSSRRTGRWIRRGRRIIVLGA